jgi:site-specific recombinase XerD
MEDILKLYQIELEFTGYDKNYYVRTKNFLLFLEQKELSYTDITYNILMEYLNSLKQTHQTGTVNNYIKAIKHLANFLFKLNKIPESTLNMVKSFSLLKVNRKHPGYYSIEELSRIVDTATICFDWIIPEKSKAIVWFMFYTGIRKDEFLNLKRKEIDLTNRVVTILEPKAVRRVKETKFFKFPKTVADLLKEYFEKDPIEKENAFNMTIGEMNHFFKSLKEGSPLNKFNPHLLRYSYANNLHRQGVSIRHIQKLLGHRSLATTMLYVDPDQEASFAEYDKKVEGAISIKPTRRRKPKD